MNKIDLILELVKDGKITTEQAKLLMATEKEYVYYPTYPWSTATPYWNRPFYVTCGTATNNNNTFTTDGGIIGSNYIN